MRIIGLLSWFQEPTENLMACIQAMRESGVDHVVAVDGRYALYPSDDVRSSANEHAAIVLACRELGVGLTLHIPDGPWMGGEVEKRTFLFRLGWSVAQDGDWFWVQDSDQFTKTVPDDLKARLQATDHDAAEVMILDVPALNANQPDWPPRFQMRALFRAQPIHVETNHITYMTDDGRLLWGWDGDSRLEPCLDLSDVVLVEHRPERRPRDRQLAKLTYYAERDAARIERGDCERCGQVSRHLVPTRWRMTDLGPVADWMEACDACKRDADMENARELRALGVDPDSVVVENRNGHAPPPVLAP